MAAPHPDSLEELDLLLVMVAKPRTVHRDGIRFEGLRYHSPVLAPYVGTAVTIRYDPRDLGEIRVFHHNQFLCRAISPEHIGETISLKDIQAARVAHRRALRAQMTSRLATVTEYLPAPDAHRATDTIPTTPAKPPPTVARPVRSTPPSARSRPPATSTLRLYQADLDSAPGTLPVDPDEELDEGPDGAESERS
jgi:putative transposase